MKKKENINNALLNMIAPIDYKFYKNKMEIGENSGKAYGIIRYSEGVDYGWMEPLMNMSGTIAALSYEPLSEGDAMDVFNNNMKVLNNKLNETTDPLQVKKLQKAIHSSDKILEDLCDSQESVGAVTTTIMTIGKDEYIDKADSKVKGECKKGHHSYRLMANLQQQCYQHISPCNIINKKMSEVLAKPAPLRSIIGGFPFASSGFNDGSGYIYGSLTNSNNSANSNMILNPWKRGEDRNNSNIVIMGEPGSGKSTKVKDIILMDYMMGTRLFIIDPEREYKYECKKLKGNWVNAGGGKGKINPLHVRPLPTDPEEDLKDLEDTLPSLAAFLMHLKAWFQMACPELTGVQINEVERILLKTYNRFGITWETSSDDFLRLKPTDYPIMADFLEDIENELGKLEREDLNKKNDLMALKDYVDNMVNGSTQFLWNGHSTVDFNSEITVLDTHDLQDTPDNIKAAQYYNILTWIWYEASKNRQERAMIVADEAYLMIDRKIPQSLVFLRNSFKRGRKYEISFVLVSHSVVDFLHESILMYGQAILDSASIKILMGTDGQNLKDTVKQYKLTEAEEATLEMKQRGLALMIIGRMHMKVKFEIAEYKWEYFGSAGGR